jgi:Uma2 family endonuclease
METAMPAARPPVSPITAPPPPSPVAAAAVPPLVDGDRLSREEFVRRYEAMPEGFRAELIEGVVYVASPLSDGYHGTQNSRIDHWLATYSEATEGTDCGVGSTLRFLDGDDEPQPDAHLRILPEYGGRAGHDAGKFLTAAPELLVEIAASSVRKDLGPRKRQYLRRGVSEYIVWRVKERAVDWFVSTGGDFVPLPPEDGLYKSRTFPGLWMEPSAFVEDDRRRQVNSLRRGLASPEHAEFVARLQRVREERLRQGGRADQGGQSGQSESGQGQVSP